jgi:uncharacterized protein
MNVSATVRKVIGPTILLQSGEYFDFLDPDNCKVTIEDVAHGLSMICRFTGHCNEFYSVAEHSWHASYHVEPAFAFDALMHDSPESVIGDMSKPLKDICPEYRAIEDNIERSFAKKFGFQVPLAPEVKEVDLVMLTTEQKYIMKNRDDWDYTRGRKALNIKLYCWPPQVAKQMFLLRYNELKTSK